MAASGSFNTTGYQGRYLTFAWSIESQNVASNQTVINWTLKGAGDGQMAWYAAGNFKVIIDGKTVFTSAARIELYKGTLVASGTHTINHLADGTRSFSASAEAGIYSVAVNCSGSGNYTLNAIARASQPSCITWPEHTQNVGDFGTDIAIHMNRASSAFTHTVRYQFGQQKGTIATGVGTGTTWTIPLSLMNLVPNATSGSGTIYVDTYNGSTFVGTKYCGFTATVPTSVKPTVTATLEDTTGTDDIYGSPVQGLSKIKVQTTATTAYSSAIASTVILIDGVRHSASSVTTGTLDKSGSSVVQITVTDRRGRTGTWSYTMQVKAYDGPAITQLAALRCDADGTENAQGEYIKATFSAAVKALDNLNTAAYVIRYKKTAATSWTSSTRTALANVYTVTDHSFVFAADGNSTYNVEVVAADRHRSTTASTSVSTAFTLLNFHSGGTGVRLGGVADKTNTLQNDLDLVQMGNTYCFSSGGQASTYGYVLIAAFTITQAAADNPITFVLSQRRKDATMTVHLRFVPTDNQTPGLQSITYEGENYGAFMVQTGDSTWALYVQKNVSNDTITVQQWYMAPRMAGRVQITFPGSFVTELPEPYYRATPAKLRSLLDYIYPVGSIYLAYNHTNPGTLFGGTWTRLANTFLWAVDADGTIGQTGGAKEVTLTTEQLPSHSHGSVYSQHASGTKNAAWYTTSGSNLAYGAVETGGGQAHNNMPPYIQVSAWRRTA